MTLFERLTQQAKANKQRIVLAEGAEKRTLTAADHLIADGICDITLIGNPAEIKQLAAELSLKNIEHATIVDPADEAFTEKYAQLYYELRKAKGMTLEGAHKQVHNPLYLGCLLIKNGDADGQVSGALSTTGDVLRAAFQIIKPKKGISVVSGAFLMLLPEGSPYGTDGMMVFADCAVVPNPTAPELAQIAVSAAETAKVLGGFDPRVAILSFSTKGSAKHEMVDKVIEATKIAKEMAPGWLSTANFKPMQPSCLQWARARLRKATSPALPTCLYSHRSKWATSPTNSCSDSAAHRQWVLSCKAWQSRSTTCRADALGKTSIKLLSSLATKA